MAELYVADKLHHPPPPDPPLGDGNIIRVTAAPDDADGSDGDLALNTDTGELYVKSGGTWTLQSAGGGGATEVYFGTGDPNGAQTATRPAIFYDADGAIWIKTDSGSSNTGWEQKL